VRILVPSKQNDRQDACPTDKVGGIFMVGQASCLSFLQFLHLKSTSPSPPKKKKLEKKILCPYNPTKFPLLKHTKCCKMAPALEDPSYARRDELPTAPYAAT
jgi:hypothetical protein